MLVYPDSHSDLLLKGVYLALISAGLIQHIRDLFFHVSDFTSTSPGFFFEGANQVHSIIREPITPTTPQRHQSQSQQNERDACDLGSPENRRTPVPPSQRITVRATLPSALNVINASSVGKLVQLVTASRLILYHEGRIDPMKDECHYQVKH